MYTVFVRNWYKEVTNGQGRKELVPNFNGRRTVVLTTRDEPVARAYCIKWNSENKPGKLSRKAEYTSDY